MLIKQKLSLSLKEIKKLYACPLTGSYEILKLRFIIGCLTGLPPQLYLTINGEHIKSNRIEIGIKEKERLRATLILPLHPLVKEIFEKHHCGLPQVFYNDLNKALQHLLKKAGINKRVLSIHFSYGQLTIRYWPKYKWIEPNMTRAFALQNLKKAGLSTDAIHLAIGRTETYDPERKNLEKKLLTEISQNKYFKL